MLEHSQQMPSWLDELNAQQRQAVTHGEGPLLVVAGAGSGKTRTLAYRVSWLVANGVDPGRILLLTFTRRSAQEMLKRAAGAGGSSAGALSQVWGGTFHAIANRILRIYATQAGLSPDFTIMDQADAEDLLNVIRNESGMAKKDKRFPRKGTCLAIYSRRMNSTEKLEPILKKHYPWCAMWKEELTVLFKEYVARKQRHNVLDYDDLLLYWYYLLQDKVTADSIENRFDHILVDEYQDTNRIQSGILAGMRRNKPNIMVVGDDAQSIYSFRSATVRNMLDFPQQFNDTRVITLEQNYRSFDSILQVSNRLIEQANERYSKQLWSSRQGGDKPKLITCTDEEQESVRVAELVLEHYEQGIALREQAVLFRAASHSAALEIELARRNIPYRKYGGLRFLEAAHIKDLVSFLRVLENPQDELAWFRILQLVTGIGPSTAAAAFGFVRENGFDSTAIARFAAPAPSRAELAQMGALFGDLRDAGRDGPAVHIERIRSFYTPLLQRNYDNAEARSNDLAHLEQLAAGYTSRKKFLADLILDPPSSTGELAGPPSLDEDWLVLSTIHSAKGCEWDCVYLIHAADGCLPSDMSTGSQEELEEELRLTYVAMTRARDFLYLLWPLRYYTRPTGYSDRHTYAQCSRFFSAAVREGMQIIEQLPENNPGDSAADVRPDTDIGGLIRGMWD